MYALARMNWSQWPGLTHKILPVNDRGSTLTSVAIVDEVAGRLAVLTQSVEQAGFIAVPILGGSKALRLFGLFRPDVAVIHADLKSGISAAGLCGLLKSSYKGDSSAVSTIVIANETQPWFATTRHELVSDYLILPFTAHHLVKAIRRVLDAHKDA